MSRYHGSWLTPTFYGLINSYCSIYDVWTPLLPVIYLQSTQNKPAYPTTMHTIVMTSSNGNILRVTGPLWGEPPVTGGFPSQRPVTRSFDVFFDLCLKKNRLSRQSRRQWFETPPRSLWRQCNDVLVRFVVVVLFSGLRNWHSDNRANTTTGKIYITKSQQSTTKREVGCIFTCKFGSFCVIFRIHL